MMPQNHSSFASMLFKLLVPLLSPVMTKRIEVLRAMRATGGGGGALDPL